MNGLGARCVVLVLVALVACGDDGGGGSSDGGTNARCGDGVVDPGEACDDGNTVDADGCSSTCVLPACGDGVLDSGEQCDAGSANSDTNANACRTTCMTARCGDGVVDSGEGCDDGNTVESDGCLSTCVLSSCGDGVMQAPEQCDAGAANSDTAADACRTNCLVARCGDTVIDTGETCDDANTSNMDGCVGTCDLATCGDGFVRTGMEECDNGAGNNDVTPDACRTTCDLASCGDQVTDTGEACDDGNGSNLDACLGNCVAATCGDGFVWSGMEDCDDTNLDNTDACLTTCDAATCGDGFLWQGVEDCDNAGANSNTTANACRSTCKVARCGDGVVDSGEACDAAGVATASCDVDCTAAVCSDGVTNVAAGETCDDANSTPTDGCTNSCAINAGWIVYVNAAASGANNGTSWANAYTSLRNALAATTQGEIWVAAGTYYPDRGSGVTLGDRSATFTLVSNVGVYGGFAGTETSRVQRNVTANVSRLSGDIGTVSVATDNSTRVVTASSVTGAILDGFVIELGYSNGSAAGMQASGTLTIGNCTFQANTVKATSSAVVRGAALVIGGGTISIERTTFANNLAQNTFTSGAAEAGALYVSNDAVVTIRDSAFTSNTVDGSISGGASGGAIRTLGAVLRVTRTTFTSNTASGRGAFGGALWFENTAVGTPTSYIQLSTFDGNAANATVNGCRGGAIYAANYTYLSVGSTLFINNRAQCSSSFGGAVYTVGSIHYSSFRNSTFAFNSSYAGYTTNYGGAVYMGDFANTSLTNDVFWGNNAYSQGGYDIAEGSQSNGGVSSSCTQTTQSGTGNTRITSSPFGSNYRLAAGSVCIDSGTNANSAIDALDLDGDANITELIPYDHSGHARFVDDPATVDTGFGTPPIVDRGAFERF